MKIVYYIFASALLLFLLFHFSSSQKPEKITINGLSLVAPPQPVDSTSFSSVVEVGASWVAVIPYAFSMKGKPNVHFDAERQWWGEHSKGATAQIQLAKAKGLKVMLKPHVWVRGQGWPGDFELETEEDWGVWEKDYESYILKYAQLADSLEVELFCIGCEYRKAVVARREFWEGLINKVRGCFKGKVTYASNWDNYQNVGFWDKLDYIGVDGYFPLSEQKSPTLDELLTGWEKPKNELVAFAEKHEKLLLFTEIGYESTDYNTAGHWIKDKPKEPNESPQAIAYQAFFEIWQKEEVYAGAFFWKWYLTERKGRNYETGFTPQGKDAEGVLGEVFGGIKESKFDLESN
ncbi:hypothetical protein R9C00_02340 [Flammeovirgaceae bacterium SG7u.111]|nr:hypothetical protein R9C00_02340 [Flammeovirgaceae bacterium SG7u.111]